MDAGMEDANRLRGASPFSAEVDSNRLTFFPHGPDRLEALIALIDGASRTLRLLYYIFKEDRTGSRVREALLAACRRGVKVTILVDGFGTQDVPDSFYRLLEESECGFCRFEPRFGRRYLLRNHQKLVVADEERAMIGGFNIAEEYFGTVEEGAWRDLGVGIHGPIVAAAAAYFDDIYAWSQAPDARLRDLRRIVQRHSRAKPGKLRWLYGGPLPRLSPWAKAINRDMLHARRLDLVAAYFAPGRPTLRRLYAVAARGTARVITAAKSDNGATIGAARHTYWRLLRRGVEVYEYQATRLHTKLIVVDDVVHVGSANFDMRSFYLNLEVMLRIEDAEVARLMREFVDGEVADSLQVTRELHRKQRSWFNRMKWSLCYFVVATMDYNVTRRLNFKGGLP
jgi:cardiolipin synthase